MITASIVTYHTNPGELRNCLATLAQSAADEVFVVDNGRENSIEEVSKEFGATYIPHDNRGYGAGHNAAIRQAMAKGSEYHLVMNSDIEFDGASIGKIANYMDTHPRVGQLQPNILNPDGTLQYTCRLLPTPADLFLRRFVPKAMFGKRRKRYILAQANREKEFDCAYQQGSFIFFRMSALSETGLFDERFFMYPEDIDISRRVASSGWRVRYWPGVTVVHRHRAASYHSWHMLKVHMSNIAIYFNKWGWFADRERKRLNKLVLSQFDLI